MNFAEYIRQIEEGEIMVDMTGIMEREPEDDDQPTLDDVVAAILADSYTSEWLKAALKETFGTLSIALVHRYANEAELLWNILASQAEAELNSVQAE